MSAEAVDSFAAAIPFYKSTARYAEEEPGSTARAERRPPPVTTPPFSIYIQPIGLQAAGLARLPPD